MVYALKSYSNQDYRRDANKKTLNTFIRKFSKESTLPYRNYPTEKQLYIDRSIQKLAINSIIEGNFPKENIVRQMAIERVNKTLCIILGLLITAVIISYYFVITYEVQLSDLSRQTIVLNNENAELQNKLDTLKSFNNVDKTLQKNNLLQKSGQVVEINEIIVSSKEQNKKSAKRKLFNYAIGF